LFVAQSEVRHVGHASAAVTVRADDPSATVAVNSGVERRGGPEGASHHSRSASRETKKPTRDEGARRHVEN